MICQIYLVLFFAKTQILSSIWERMVVVVNDVMLISFLVADLEMAPFDVGLLADFIHRHERCLISPDFIDYLFWGLDIFNCDIFARKSLKFAALKAQYYDSR